MGRGGKREGSGRKKGSPTFRTQQVAEAHVRAGGRQPLDVMLYAMTRHADADDWDKAAAIAEKAAPYLHPRLQSVAHTGPDGTGPIEAKLSSNLDRAKALALLVQEMKGRA